MAPACLVPPHARIYGFAPQLTIGKLCERTIDQTLGPLFNIKPASREQDYNLGVDRILQDPDGVELWAQAKTDCAAHRTGKVFIELALRNSRADLFVFLLPGLQKLLVFTAGIVLDIDDWMNLYGLRHVENANYSSSGVPVPLNELLPLAWYILPVNESDLPCHRCPWVSVSQNAA